jgi:hypothetical protein
VAGIEVSTDNGKTWHPATGTTSWTYSWVAHGSPGKHREKPTVRNMLLMVDFLKAKGFTDITVFSDAALRHRLEETELLKDIKAQCTYRETPAETAADLFLIAFVKRHHCLIVSNDTFREWKMQDSWVAENMDYYRLSFLIKGAEVLMPDLDVAWREIKDFERSDFIGAPKRARPTIKMKD